MSSSMATTAPAPASAWARSAGVVDMLAAYTRPPAAFWPSGGPGDVLLVADRAAPPLPARRLPGRLAAADQQPQVLPDAVDVLARGGNAAPPDADPRPARLVDHQAGQAGAQRPGDVPLLLVPAGQRFHHEPAVERGEQPGPAGTGDLRPRRHLPGEQLPRVRAAVVQHVGNGAAERGDRDLRPVSGPHVRDGHPAGKHRGGSQRHRLGGRRSPRAPCRREQRQAEPGRPHGPSPLSGIHPPHPGASRTRANLICGRSEGVQKDVRKPAGTAVTRAGAAGESPAAPAVFAPVLGIKRRACGTGRRRPRRGRPPRSP